MKAKDIRFKNEYCFNVKIDDKRIDFKENNLYEYQVRDDVLLIGNQDGFALAELNGPVTKEALERLAEFKDRNLLRLNKITNNTYFFSLFGFYEKVNYDNETPFEIVIDQAIEPALRKRRIRPEDAVDFFSEEILLDGNICFAYGENRKAGSINLIGKTINVQVKESTQGYLHIIDFNERKSGGVYDSIIALITGAIRFLSPQEVTKALTAKFKKNYNALIHDNSELIYLWRIYDALDLECIKEEAMRMGVIKYKSFRRQNDNLVFSLEGYVFDEFLIPNMCYVAVSRDDFDPSNPLGYDNKKAVSLGSEWDPTCKNKAEFVITDEVDFDKTVPAQGYIVPSIFGSVIQNKRRNIAQQKILSGTNRLPGLNVLLQSGEVVGVVGGKHRMPVSESLRKKIFGRTENNFNDKQKEAIDIAINTPDIAIIQGPPGTGKTTVIKGIVERIHELENGEARILIASTQHEAVDNAVQGVTYNGVPVNRVYNRKQKQYKDSPIYNWIDEMRKKCQQWMEGNPRRAKFSKLHRLLNEIHDAEGKVQQSVLETLRHELQRLNFSVNILKQVDECVLALIDSQNISLDVESNKRLQNELDKQRTDVASFLGDGVENISTLIKYLQFERIDIDFTIPDYWRKLKRATEETDDMHKWITAFATDVRYLKDRYCSQQESGGELSEKIDSLVKNIKKEVGSIEIPKEEKLYDLIWTFSHELSNPGNVKDLITSYSQLNAATCQQTANKNINPGMKGFGDSYDYVIIDEAARSNPLDLMIPVSLGKKIILVGDSKQLPHLVDRNIIKKVEEKTGNEGCGAILEESLFLRLFNLVGKYDAQNNCKRTCSLTEQRRMHPDICEIVNQFYSDSPLVSMCTKEEKAHGLGLYHDKALCWIDIPYTKETNESGKISKTRECEVEVIADELTKILSKNHQYKIGIISFYSAQVSKLQNMVEEKFPDKLDRISIGTVDAFQGKEFDVVLLSTVRSNDREELRASVGFLNDDRRLCVAFSRAKRLLITVGDSKTVAYDENGNEKIKALNELLKACRDTRRGYYDVKNI